MRDKKFLQNYAWLNMGSQRREIMKLLPEKPFQSEKFRKEIVEKDSMKISLREISRHLTSFVERGFVVCINPEAPYKKLFVLTEKGKKLREYFLNG